MQMLLGILTVFFIALYAVLFIFYYLEWKKVPLFKPAETTKRVFVSILIAARNEEKTLPILLKDLLQQDYPKDLFEIIVVDDFSTDNTVGATKGIAENIKLIKSDTQSDRSSKKAAIATGVRFAAGELLIITDADCRVKEKWISTYVSFYLEKNASFIAAPVLYNHNSSVLEIFQSLDFLTLQGITAASVSSGFHNMCNGANLAYTKKAFLAVDGFAGIDKVASGDDMLLMHKIWKNNPDSVFYLKNKNVIVTTSPMSKWKHFINQRRRWASKTMVYQDKRILSVLIFVLLFNLLFIVLFVYSFIASNYFWLLVLFLFSKTIIELPFVRSVADFFNEIKWIKQFIVLQPLHILYTVYVGLISQFGKYEWKGRKVQ